ncbi:MAG: TMEM165/GDT1 family protein [Candidatus Omnitrophica bacterium]|nr:TMEM165/GDT1 family protein [Candidatus Omnitrophota bacterium]MCM8817794.1 TMEM165/GDT1 family protein [Candidatus Omnitrophota bacterium]
MNWQFFWLTFATIFLAEIGDKTQLVCFSMSAKSASILPVFLGAMTAFVLSTLVACLLGGFLSKVVPVKIVHSIAGVILVAAGIFILIKEL